MSRSLCLALAVVSLAAAPGCSSCFGSSCRRPSFMEFRSPCSGRHDAAPACGPACGPACAPACEPACGPAPCCEGGAVGGTVMPSAAPVVLGEQGTFS